MKDKDKRKRPFWLKIVIALCLSFSLLVVGAAILFVYSAHDAFRGWSYVTIRNSSGLDVRVERVTIDDQLIWTWEPLIGSPKDLPLHWLGDKMSVGMLEFRGPTKLVELKVVIVTKTRETETLSCMLDNRSPPCLFEVLYRKGKLLCPCDCDKHFLH